MLQKTKQPTSTMRIREFNEEKDLGRLRACLIELQDFEHSLDARMPTGRQIVDQYLPQIFERCEDCDGIVLIAEIDGEVAGYTSVLNRVTSDEIEEGSLEYALISDLIVASRFRGRGVGRRLLQAAEAHARSAGVNWLRVGALANNHAARALYESAGFSYLYVELEKDLGELE
ncbi:MAG TPA: GNAT family N-acetyltransferase [Woeseiaceae bacterium]|nr:GNAT family N-acetyltransferase [Woeseiaceae bacterium]